MWLHGQYYLQENGCTPLFIATLLGSLEIVKLLIRYKANVTTTDKVIM